MRKHVVYIDDIIIYLKILLEHVKHDKLVLITQKRNLILISVAFAWNFFFFCFIVRKYRIERDKKKVKVIIDLLTPKSF